MIGEEEVKSMVKLHEAIIDVINESNTSGDVQVTAILNALIAVIKDINDPRLTKLIFSSKVRKAIAQQLPLHEATNKGTLMGNLVLN